MENPAMRCAQLGDSVGLSRILYGVRGNEWASGRLTGSGRSVLHVAALTNHMNCISVLLSFDLKLLVQVANNGDTPLHLAVYKGHLETVMLLTRSYRAPVQIANSVGQTPLDYARHFNHPAIHKFLKFQLPGEKAAIALDILHTKRRGLFPILPEKILLRLEEFVCAEM